MLVIEIFFLRILSMNDLHLRRSLILDYVMLLSVFRVFAVLNILKSFTIPLKLQNLDGEKIRCVNQTDC